MRPLIGILSILQEPNSDFAREPGLGGIGISDVGFNDQLLVQLILEKAFQILEM
jgi:hypothetical protein